MSPEIQPPESSPAAVREGTPRLGTTRYPAVKLLAVLALLFLSSPFVEDLPGGDLIEAILVTGVMVFSVVAMGARRRTLTIALLLVTPAIVGKWANHFFPGVVSSLIYLPAAVVFFAFVVAHLIQFILRSPKVDANVLCAGLSGYLLLGLLWVPLYILVARIDPGAFNLPSSPGAPAVMNGFNAFYFSFTTLSTVGYGDFTPVSRGARMLAVTEAIVGLFYVAVLISRLVAIYSSTPPPAGSDGDSKTDVTGK